MKNKFFKTLFVINIIYFIIVYITAVTLGNYIAIMIIPLLILLLAIIFDSYVDSLLTDPKYIMSESELETFGNKKIIYKME